MSADDFARRLWYEVEEFRADELFLSFAKIPAVRVIDKCKRGVWQVAANQLGLALHHAAIPVLALAQRLYRTRPLVGRPEARGDVAHQLRLVRTPIPRLWVING